MDWMLSAVYLSVVNLLGFSLMGVDKRRAIRSQWRIPEKKLFLTALLGGSIGSWIGMYAFRHKTRHMAFVAGMPLILLFQIFLGVWIVWRLF